MSIKDWIFSKVSLLNNSQVDSVEKISCFFYHLWAVWLSRNRFMFDKQKVDPSKALETAKLFFNDFWAANTKPPLQEPNDIMHTVHPSRWKPPPDGFLKFNVDAALDIQNNLAAVAVVVRESSGAMPTGVARRFICDSVDRAEAEAVLEAMHLAVALEIRRPIFEGDNLTIINACNGQPPPWQASTAINSIRDLHKNFAAVSYHWTPRKQNSVADWVARSALKLSLPAIWSWLPPVELRALILQDLLVPRDL